jgi:predicted dehydrogenase/threonine dehydrogenase-like Zn-dependent dehydrogenase
MKQLLQNIKDGKAVVVDVPIPSPRPGTVLVQTNASLVSAGTERMVVEFAQKSLVGKAASRPDLVKQVLDKARREGVVPTLNAALNKLDQPMALGYSSAGIAVELGEGVTNFQVGDRVACAGGGYAVHAEYAIVPVNLVAKISATVPMQEGAFATLGSIAMHGFRLAEPQLGESVVIVGLGLLGLITAEISKAAGCNVIGVDLDEERVLLAREMGYQAFLRQDAEPAIANFTENLGADIVLICADTPSNDPVIFAGNIARDRGSVISLGAVGLDIPRSIYFYKELTFKVSRSYGPGRYDSGYEEGGNDYPIGFVRWTAGRNLKNFVALIDKKLINLKPLISHRIPIENATKAYEMITGKTNEKFLGVVLTYPTEENQNLAQGKIQQNYQKLNKKVKVRVGILGAGNFANAALLPALKKQKNIEVLGIVSASGLSAQHAANKFSIGFSASDEKSIFENDSINTVAVLTRHNLHANQVIAALNAGKHVLVEKPLAINQDELNQIKKAVSKNPNQLLSVGFNRRFAPLAIKMKDFISASKEPIMAHYRVNAGLLPLDHWTQDSAIGGGRIIGEGCHFIDFLTWIIGSLPIEVYAAGLPSLGKYRQDNVVLNFRFANGSIGTVTYLANGDKSVPKEEVEIFSGGLVANLHDYRSLSMVKNGNKKEVKSTFSQDKGHAKIWEAFASSIEKGNIPPIPYEEIFAVTQASFAAVTSLNTNAVIKI